MVKVDASASQGDALLMEKLLTVVRRWMPNCLASCLTCLPPPILGQLAVTNLIQLSDLRAVLRGLGGRVPQPCGGR